ncbi:methyl-accepting chemotaxis protein [Sporosarcina sp. FSL K6-3457]|uniref:methyl-accepting chemotaxis protein n=1 Tax=Sporosarcina sp. FSL K6-3457 TaxID=2978204 RepID=UPI0030FAB277
MLSNRTKVTIKQRLILSFLLVSLVPMFIVAIVIYNTSVSEIVNQEEDSMQQFTESTAQGIEEWIGSRASEIKLASKTEEITSLDSKKQNQLVNIIKEQDPAYEVIIFVDTEGIARAHTTKEQIDVQNLSERNYFQNGMKGEDTISNVLISGTTGNQMIALSTPVFSSSGKITGVLVATLNFNHLVDKYLNNENQNLQPIIVDSSDVIQVHPNADLIGKSLDESNLDAKWLTVFEEGKGSSGYTTIGKKSDAMLVSAAPIELVDYGLYFVSPMKAILSATEKTKLFSVIIFGVSVLVILAVALFIASRISRPIRQVTDQVKAFSDGDFSVNPLIITSSDETGYLADSLNKMQQNLHQLITQIGENSSQVSAASEELMASAEQSSQASEHITLTVEEVASGAEVQMGTVERTVQNTDTLSMNVNQIASHAKLTSTLSEQALGKAGTGNETIQSTVIQMESIYETMKELSTSITGMSERSKEIDQIVEVISGIAAQTNLLALNAAIEAARAGEQGKGFAVVANEVRHLAEQSSHSAQQITQLISNVQMESNNSIRMMEKGQKEVEDGVQIVHVAGQLFAEIKHDLNDVAEKSMEVLTSTNQMIEGTVDVVESISHISDISNRTLSGTQNISAASEEQLASMEEISSSATVLAGMAENLQEMILKFKL